MAPIGVWTLLPRIPAQILVSMENSAGVFQIEKVLERKIRASSIQDLVEVAELEKGIQIRISENS